VRALLSVAINSPALAEFLNIKPFGLQASAKNDEKHHKAKTYIDLSHPSILIIKYMGLM